MHDPTCCILHSLRGGSASPEFSSSSVYDEGTAVPGPGVIPQKRFRDILHEKFEQPYNDKELDDMVFKDLPSPFMTMEEVLESRDEYYRYD